MMKYNGSGRFIPGIPARDLTEDEARDHGGYKELEATGLYIRVKKDEVDKPEEEQEGEA